MTDLSRILEESRPALEAGIASAERELAELDERRRELMATIARARAALGDGVPVAARDPAGRYTLHEAMQLLLDENGNQWMSVHQLAEEINARALYEKRDRSPVDPSQIHARANKYPHLFEKQGSRIRRAADG